MTENLSCSHQILFLFSIRGMSKNMNSAHEPITYFLEKKLFEKLVTVTF